MNELRFFCFHSLCVCIVLAQWFWEQWSKDKHERQQFLNELIVYYYIKGCAPKIRFFLRQKSEQISNEKRKQERRKSASQVDYYSCLFLTWNGVSEWDAWSTCRIFLNWFKSVWIFCRFYCSADDVIYTLIIMLLIKTDNFNIAIFDVYLI